MVKRFFTLLVSTFISLAPLLIFSPTVHAVTSTSYATDCVVMNCGFSHGGSWAGKITSASDFQILLNHPFITLLIISLLAAAIGMIAHHYSKLQAN